MPDDAPGQMSPNLDFCVSVRKCRLGALSEHVLRIGWLAPHGDRKAVGWKTAGWTTRAHAADTTRDGHFPALFKLQRLRGNAVHRAPRKAQHRRLQARQVHTSPHLDIPRARRGAPALGFSPCQVTPTSVVPRPPGKPTTGMRPRPGSGTQSLLPDRPPEIGVGGVPIRRQASRPPPPPSSGRLKSGRT